MNYIQFQNTFIQFGIFSVKQIELYYPGFNTDNLLYWQKKKYINRLRNSLYCFADFLAIPDSDLLIANMVYTPSYISQQQALSFYGLIPEFIIDSTSITTKKTMNMMIDGRTFKYYSVKESLFFGYVYKELLINNLKRNVLMADREKALLDFLYIFNFNKNEQDLEQLRLNETILTEEVDWNKIQSYLDRFGSPGLDKKVKLIQNIYHI
jgi:predicted transcriptional regulator of viral defense system